MRYLCQQKGKKQTKTKQNKTKHNKTKQKQLHENANAVTNTPTDAAT